jgi:hypothetical protein
VAGDDDRDFVHQFLVGWDQWQRLYPRPYEIAKMLLMGSLRDRLIGPIPEVVNDVWDCDANIYLDMFREDLYVKSVMKLFQPNKELGGPNGWVTSGRLDSYLSTIQMMLNALSLEESELELIHIPAGKQVIDELLKALGSI